MEPAFYRGDLLFLTNFESESLNVGDITVFKVDDREIPIVHRVLRIHQSNNGTVKFLTKGDNNAVDDRALYPQGQDWLEEKHVMGKAKGYGSFLSTLLSFSHVINIFFLQISPLRWYGDYYNE
ncbi:Signal peptidase complex catalytic subunit S11A [Hymenolepis weldensis]